MRFDVVRDTAGSKLGVRQAGIEYKVLARASPNAHCTARAQGYRHNMGSERLEWPCSGPCTSPAPLSMLHMPIPSSLPSPPCQSLPPCQARLACQALKPSLLESGINPQAAHLSILGEVHLLHAHASPKHVSEVVRHHFKALVARKKGRQKQEVSLSVDVTMTSKLTQCSAV